MKIILSETNNPFFNIACEEFLLKKKDDDILYLYINEPSIICGKHQNLLAEINPLYVFEKKTPVVRRLSGGGTVYHDLGNLNFCFIQNVKEGNLVDFKRYIAPFVDFLSLYGINAEIGIKNDIKIDGKKVSGNAEHVWKKRVLHHGTLLYNSNLENLQKSLSNNDDAFASKAVKSNRSQTTNILPYMNEKINIHNFKNKIADYFIQKTALAKKYKFSNEDLLNIQTLIDEKYSTWDWTFGYSPKYSHSCWITINNVSYSSIVEVEKGIIIKITFENQNIKEELIKKINNKYSGTKHNVIFSDFTLQNHTI